MCQRFHPGKFFRPHWWKALHNTKTGAKRVDRGHDIESNREQLHRKSEPRRKKVKTEIDMV
jgi:hypothetical protein